MRRPFAYFLAIASPLALLAGEAPVADAAQARIRAAVARVYDTTVLHRIDIVIAPRDVAAVQRVSDTRVPCTFTFDGVTLTNVGIRQSGGDFHPYVSLTGKPSLSIKFNEFVPGQKLHGVGRMILKNESQDLSFVNEHMTYEVFRRAGLAVPITAHAIVTINGHLNGIYLMREPINEDFLVRNFGKGVENGNIYEVDIRRRDFVDDPSAINLKDEMEDNRSRSDIRAIAAAVRAATPENFMANVGKVVDLDNYLTSYAVDFATGNFDGFSLNSHNSYLYMHPKNGMIVLPWGADQTFTYRTVERMQRGQPLFTRKLRTVPGIDARLLAEIARVGRAPIWDAQALLDRVAQVGRILDTAPPTDRTNLDVARFRQYRPDVEAFIRAGGNTRGSVRLP